jgi:hypothetical protein
MDRAQELRTKKKEIDLNQESSTDLSSFASQSEIQRQRRSRQLEETQKLLDGKGGGLKPTESLSVGSTRINSFSDGGNSQRIEKRGRESALPFDERPVGGGTKALPFDEQPVGGGSKGTHSIVTEKQLGNIHRQYQEKSESSSVSSRSNLNAKSITAAAEDDFLRIINESKRVGTLDASMLEDPIRPALREMPQEGRGRGRGRGRSHPSLTGGTAGLGESRGSAGSLSHISATGNEEFGFKSNSPWTTKVHSSSSQSLHSRSESVNAVTKSLQSYVKSRQVPEFKEGDCAKLTSLRQRLVARRRKRETSNKVGSIERKVQSSQSQRSVSTVTESSPGTDSRSGEPHSDEHSRSGEGLNPNDLTARDFQRKPLRPTSHQESVASTPGMQPATSVYKSQNAELQSDQVDGDEDDDDDNDEASVVDIELIQCDVCKRKFAPKIYEKHFDNDGQPKCAKDADRKRPVYNAAMVRIGNNDNLNKDEQMIALQVSQNLSTKAPKKKSKKSSKWREESVAFREAMKANRLVRKAEKKEEVPRQKKHSKSRSGR